VSRPIVTVTLNPAIDEAISIGAIALGEINRCRFDSLDAGGKGLNASRVMHRLGRATLVLGFVGGLTGTLLRALLDAEGVPHALDDVEEMTRMNVMLRERGAGRRTRLYLPGPHIGPSRLEDLQRRLEAVDPGGVVVLGGSLPPGLPESTYFDLVDWLRSRGVRAVVDTSAKALMRVLPARPALIKPNADEAGALLNRRVVSGADAVEAARQLQRLGAENVVISLGAAGAVGVGPDGAWKAVGPQVEVRSTVGSGDSMVAGLAIALNEHTGLAEGLRLGTAAGAGTAMSPATHLCRREDFDRLLPAVTMHAL
jgi:6-phosphofructokinase 2